MDSSPQSLTKLDAARRQLRMAIHLFLKDEDAIAVHTLTSASLQVLLDLGAKADIKSMIKNPAFVRPEKKSELSKIINAPQNFFKHADKDPDSVLKFYPETTPFFIIDAVLIFEKITGTKTTAGKVFHTWFSMNFLDVLVDGAYKAYIEKKLQDDPSLKDKKISYEILLELEKNGA